MERFIELNERENILQMINYGLVDTLVDFGCMECEFEDVLIRKGYPIKNYICIDSDYINILKAKNRLFKYPNSAGNKSGVTFQFSENLYSALNGINPNRSILILSEGFIENIRYLDSIEIENLFSYISSLCFKYVVYQGVYYNPLEYGVNWEYIRNTAISNEIVARWFRNESMNLSDKSLCRYIVEYILRWAYHDYNTSEFKNGYTLMSDFAPLLYGKSVLYSRVFNSRELEHIVQNELGINLNYLGTLFIETIIQN